MSSQMNRTRTKIGQGGRIVIPAEFRQALGLRVGDTVILRLEDDEVRVVSLRQAIKRAQDLVRQYVPADRSLSDELIAERRAEAERE